MMIVVFMLIVMVIMDDDVVRDWAPPKSFCRESYDMWCQPKWWWGGEHCTKDLRFFLQIVPKRGAGVINISGIE